MNTAITDTAGFCSISESIVQSCKEVKLMHEGKMPKRSLNDLFSNIEKWSKEEN